MNFKFLETVTRDVFPCDHENLGVGFQFEMSRMRQRGKRAWKMKIKGKKSAVYDDVWRLFEGNVQKSRI